MSDRPTKTGPSSGQIVRSAGVVALVTLASRILGLVRDAVIAAFFNKASTDAFFIAFTIPNVFRSLLAEGALTVAFIPVFTEYRQRHGEAPAREFLRCILGAAALALVVVTLLGELSAPWLVKAFAPGFVGEPVKLELATFLTRVVFGYLIAVGLTALAMGVLNSYQHFVAPAAAPVVLNVCMIGSVIVGTTLMRRIGAPPPLAIASGVVLGGLAQLSLQLPFLRRVDMLVWPRFGWTHPGVRRVLRLMGPSVFALGIYQIKVMLARQFASMLPEGSVSAVYYAQRLIEFPMGVFAVALATVSMPTLSSHATAGDMQQVKATLGQALRLTFFLLLPAGVGLAAVGQPLTAMLFQRGAFGAQMTALTAVTLTGFVCGLWAAGGVKQVVQVFYALQDTKTPVKISAASLLVFAASALLLYRRLGTFGLGLSVACGSVANFLLLLLMLRRRLGRLGLASVAASATKALVASLACGGVARWVASWGQWSAGASLSNLVCILFALCGGVATYVVLGLLLRCTELTDLSTALRRQRS